MAKWKKITIQRNFKNLNFITSIIFNCKKKWKVRVGWMDWMF